MLAFLQMERLSGIFCVLLTQEKQPTITMGTMLYFLFPMGCSSDYDIVPRKPDIDPSAITACDFEQVDDTSIHRYTCNPILTQEINDSGRGIDGVGFSVTEVLGHPFYQVWYTSSSEESGGYSLNYAVSSDGIQWEHHPSNPVLSSEQGFWDQDVMSVPIVFRDPTLERYVLAYQGATFASSAEEYGEWGMGISTSEDGVYWSRIDDEPVIDFVTDFYQSFDADIRPCWPVTMQANDTGYVGYITASVVGSNHACQLYSLQSTDLMSWDITTTEPILTTGLSFDRMGFMDASIVEWTDPETGDSTLYMFYIGFAEFVEQGTVQQASDSGLGIAMSIDGGLTWSKHSDNPLPIAMTDYGHLSSVDARVVGSRIHLWIGDLYDGEGGIGYFYYEPSTASE